jgi:nitrate reductase gamma subunit
MMDYWLDLARGPLFYCAFTLMVLGLIRHLVLTVVGIRRMVRRAGHPTLPYGTVLKATLLWLFPFSKMNNRVWYSILSVVFHVGLIITPIFLSAHILLWKRGIGLSWPGLSQNLSDILTLITIATCIGLLIGRTANRHSRYISRFQDFTLLILLGLIFISGFLAGRPEINPFSYKAVMLLHAMSGNIAFILVPFTKLAHAVLLPTTQLVSEAAWHFPAASGVQVAEALQKEAQQV